ncbi:hypothetical protein Tco_1384920 [Tanacetum coccineum]
MGVLYYDSPLLGVNTPGSDEEMNEQQDLTDLVPLTSHDSPLSRGHTPRSDEGRPNINELMAICTNLSNRVLSLEQSKTAQDLVINKLQKKVTRLEKALRTRTPGMKLFKIGTSRRKGLDKENVSKQGRKSDKTKPMFKDSDFNVLDDAMENVKGGSTADPSRAMHNCIILPTSTAEQITIVGDTLNTGSINVSAAGPSTSTTGDIFEDEMTIIVDTLVAIRSARPRITSVVICNVEEEPRRATSVPTVQSQDKDEELAQRLFEEEQAQFEREQRIARERATEQEAKDVALIEQMEYVQARMDADELLAARLQEQEREYFFVDEQARFLVETIAARKKFFAAQRPAEIRNRPPTRTQLRNQMITYLKHMGKYTHNQLKSKSFEEIQKLYKKEHQWINDFVPMSDDSGKKDDSSSKQAESNDAEKEELRACLDIVQGDDITIDVESLATKYPIVDWKTHILTENMMYYQIIRADGSSKNYKIFSEMLDDFNRQDVMDLHRLVKERYDTTSPEGYDLLLWGDLKTLFEPCEEDEVWRNQQGYNLISWRLFDSCGVHVLLMDNGIAIHMMIENKYLLTQEMLSRMLNRRLEVDHESKMAFELLRFIRSQLKNLEEDCWESEAFYNLMLLVQVCATAED